MGYRQLLKNYIAHVEALVGNDLVEIAALTNAVNKRDLGELRALAAELQREAYAREFTGTYHNVIRAMVAAGDITLEQLGQIQGIEPSEEPEDIPEQSFRRIVQSLADTVDT